MILSLKFECNFFYIFLFSLFYLILQGSNSPDEKKSSRSLADVTNCQVDTHIRTQTMNTAEILTPSLHPRSEVLGDRTFGELKVGHRYPLTSTATTKDKTVRKSIAGMNANDHPRTSTAVFEERFVRRSTRQSTRLSFQAALADNLSPCESMISFMSHENTTALNISKRPSFLEDTTVLYSESNDGSPVLRPFIGKKTGAGLQVTKIEKKGYVEELGSNNDVKEELSTDAELMNEACALPISNKIEHRDGTNLATHSIPQEWKTSVAQLEEERLQTEKSDVNRKRRRSSRVSALNATLRNHQILHNESPILRSRRRSTANLNETRGEFRLLHSSTFYILYIEGEDYGRRNILATN